jgi:hypothetical protein
LTACQNWFSAAAFGGALNVTTNAVTVDPSPTVSGTEVVIFCG